MGRPSPGGEEARVVVHQPRGVGLMHTRPRPSGVNYTHDDACGRKHSDPSQRSRFRVIVHASDRWRYLSRFVAMHSPDGPQ